MKKIVFFTSTRAEYGLLRTLILQSQKESSLEVALLVSGAHLSATYGSTLSEIEKDNLPLGAIVDISLNRNHALPDSLNTCKSMGIGMEKFGEALYNLKPDLLVILGDRYEAFCCASAATILNIPIAHLHGGEQTLGAIDEAFRHSITKMSHLHFASCEEHRQRILQLGEQPEHVWNTGALGVENALNMKLLCEEEVRAQLNISPQTPYFLCTFHPVTREPEQEKFQWQEIQKAFEAFPNHAVIITGANADPGGNEVNTFLAKWAENNPTRIHFFASLGVLRYLSAAKYADCVVGNSSSGIIEIPSLQTPVVNIGNRQRGRVCSGAIVHCEAEANAIKVALKKSLSLEKKTIAMSTPNPYAGNDVAKKIVKILTGVKLATINQKKFNDLQQTL